jgi:hypothetical protein
MPDHEVTKVRRWDEIAPVYGYEPQTLSAREELVHQRPETIHEFKTCGLNGEISLGRDTLWIIVRWPNGAGVAIRGVFSPEGDLEAVNLREEDGALRLTLSGTTTGEFRCRLACPDPNANVFRWSVSLIPVADLLIPPSPWNVYPIDPFGDPIPTKGIVHAAQRGSAAGILYFTLTEPRSGSVLYFQNLTALGEYCEITHTDTDGCLGNNWPGLGFQIPPSERIPLPSGQEIGVCDFLVNFSEVVPENDRETARLFVELLADVYRSLPRREPDYRHWPSKAEATLRDLTVSSKCSLEQNGYLYLRPYVSAEYPDSMTQLTVTLPLWEYAEWLGREIPLVEDLKKGLWGFFDPKIGTIRRYLATVGKEKNADELDSWYLYHPLMNLGRLAQRGDDRAKEMFFGALDYAIDAAHRFEYWWPIQFNLKTLEVIKGDRKPGEAGQTDVSGLYAKVMLHAYDLSGDPKYIEEAKRSIEALKGLSFSIGYQFNNVAYGINACLRLWKETGNAFFRDQSYVFLASFLHNANLWECDFGCGKYYRTFMGVTCLHDGNYMAAYEEFESFAAFHESLDLAGDDLPRSVRLLINEFCRYALDHAWFYYPGELPREILAKETRNGHIDRSLAIPLEDLYAGWEAPGAIGQEVYGCGAAFAYVTRAYRRVPGAPFMVYSDYRMAELEAGENEIRFRLQGDHEFRCRMRLIPDSGDRLPDAKVRIGDDGEPAEGERTPEGHLEFLTPGDSIVEIRWSS